MDFFMSRDISWYKAVFKQILKDDIRIYQNQIDCFQLLLNMRQELTFNDKNVRDYMLKISKYIHKVADYMAEQTGSGKFNELYYSLLLLEAPECFESYMLYTEKDREPKE